MNYFSHPIYVTRLFGFRLIGYIALMSRANRYIELPEGVAYHGRIEHPVPGGEPGQTMVWPTNKIRPEVRAAFDEYERNMEIKADQILKEAKIIADSRQ